MNCRPGELAQVVRSVTGSPTDHKLLGVTRVVTHIAGCNEFGPLWAYEGDLIVVGETPTHWLVCNALADCNLRPIRDPGPDAVDQTLEPGYVKHGDEVTS